MTQVSIIIGNFSETCDKHAIASIGTHLAKRGVLKYKVKCALYVECPDFTASDQ